MLDKDSIARIIETQAMYAGLVQDLLDQLDYIRNNHRTWREGQ